MTPLPKMAACPKCAKNTLKETSFGRMLEAAGLTFAGDIPSQTCGSCGEEYVSGPGLIAFDLAVAMKVIAMGVRTGTAHRFCRKAAGMSNEDIAALYGVDPEDVPFFEEAGICPADRFWDILIPRVEKEFDGCALKPDVQLKYP